MLNSVYMNLPRSLQNAAMTAYGWKMYRQRFGGEVPGPYNRIESVFETIKTDLLAQQAKRFALLVSHVAKTVPYYQSLFKQLGITPQDVNLINMADFFPVIKKQDILSQPKQFITTDARCLKGAFLLNTSGSSGTPMQVISSLEARRINYFFYQLALSEYGLHYRSRSTTFAGRVLYKGGSNQPARIDRFNNTQYLSSYQVSDDSIEIYIRELNRWQPEFIDSYPSVLRELASLASARGLKLEFRPKILLTSSESLTDSSRQKIEAFFGAAIMDHYGCTEMAVSAFYRDGQYHVHPLYSFVELEPLAAGSYSLLATGLVNFAMPLIRYSIGDSVVTDNPSNAYLFQAIEGRIDDLVVTPEGRKIGRLDPAFKGVEGILLAQVVQHAVDRLEIKVVLSKGSSPLFDEVRLANNFRELTSSCMKIEISYHDDIERGANGKFKSVVSLLDGAS